LLNRQISPCQSLSADRPVLAEFRRPLGEAAAARGAFFGWRGRIDTRPKFQPKSGLEDAFAAMNKAPVQALVVLTDPILFSQRKRTVDLANKNRLPAMYSF
jgi:hypothetical protein